MDLAGDLAATDPNRRLTGAPGRAPASGASTMRDDLASDDLASGGSSGSSSLGSGGSVGQGGHMGGHQGHQGHHEGGGHRVPLKTVLQNFLNHVENLEARKKEGDDAYEKEFQSLKLFSDQLKCQPDYSCAEGEKDVNRKKNRYKDILPCK